MENPLIDIKSFIANSINLYLEEKFLSESSITYNHKRKIFQSTSLFLQSEEARLNYKDKLKNFNDDSFKLLIHNNFINFKLSKELKQNFMFNFIKHIQTIPENLTPIDYFLYYKTKEDLHNIKIKAFTNAQLKLLNFYGYSVNTIIKKELTNINQILIDFELDDLKYSCKIDSFFDNNFFYESFSLKYLNLLILSKKIDADSYETKILRKLNTKNPFYITAYVIARLNHLNLMHCPEINKVLDQKALHFSLLLAKILDNNKNALSIYPLLGVLNKVCKNIYANNFYNFDINKLAHKMNLINFLTSISQTTFLYY